MVRESGATAWQIEAAAYLAYGRATEGRHDNDFYERTSEYRKLWIDYYQLMAEHLVPPTHRIVSIDDLNRLLMRLPSHSEGADDMALRQRIEEVMK